MCPPILCCSIDHQAFDEVIWIAIVHRVAAVDRRRNGSCEPGDRVGNRTLQHFYSLFTKAEFQQFAEGVPMLELVEETWKADNWTAFFRLIRSEQFPIETHEIFCVNRSGHSFNQKSSTFRIPLCTSAIGGGTSFRRLSTVTLRSAWKSCSGSICLCAFWT
jgi:hypothetical protein